MKTPPTASDDDGADVQRMLLDSAADFLRTAHSLKRVHQLRAAQTSFDTAVWRAMAQCGWLGMPLPEGLGGAGLSIEPVAAMAALFGAALLPEPFATCAVAPATLLAAAAEAPQTAALAQGLCDGSQVLALAWQERIGQVSADWAGLTATPEGHGFRLHGRKVLVEGAANHWLVTGIIGTDPVVLVVASQAAGVTPTSQRMTDGSLSLSLDFAGTWVAADAVVLRGEPARNAVDAALDAARLVLAAQLAGIAAGALDLSMAYVAQRVQFGQPISSFQVIRHRLVDLDLQRRLSFASWRHAARLSASPGCDAKTRSTAVSAAKARCAETALLATRSAIQLHGAMGYTAEADIGLFLAAALKHASALGNAEAHRQRFTEQTLGEALAA